MVERERESMQSRMETLAKLSVAVDKIDVEVSQP
tara:strand:+ start:118 stop:219 length:102 start_codon:yes stop_codon:yes gene_type:complete